MVILVTGATGFIGKNLVKALSKSYRNIFCLVRNPQKAKLLDTYGVNLIYTDITQFDALACRVPKKIDVIFHCAGFVSNRDRQMLHKVNVVGTENICKLALRLGVKRMVYVSSVAVVSGYSRVPLVEDLPYKATNIYGYSKIEAEKVVLSYREKGLRSAILRPCMVYGEDEPHLMRIMLCLLKYRLLPLVNSGKSKLHLVYVRNVVDALIFSLNNDGCLRGTFFIADKEVLTADRVLSIMAEAIGAKAPCRIPSVLTPLLSGIPYFGRQLRSFFKDRVYSMEKLISLGFVPSYPAESSLTISCQAFFKTGRSL
ncbi:MAG: NAD(P)-dependent oxidoreductase [Candidatus Omnitrophica bacterium]|nr:NAD(P)-dependent oxidoreductase [Candidatus Omnitrophota bacterium]